MSDDKGARATEVALSISAQCSTPPECFAMACCTIAALEAEVERLKEDPPADVADYLAGQYKADEKKLALIEKQAARIAALEVEVERMKQELHWRRARGVLKDPEAQARGGEDE